MEQPLDGSFAQRLRTLRERAALTQEELAERADLTANAIGALERGERRRPYPHTVRALAEALGLDDADRAALAAAARPPIGQPAKDTAQVDLDARPGWTSEPATPLLGREVELAAVTARLRAKGTRLLTLTGPGGVGKTRLALAAAAELRSEFPDGVAVAELAPVQRSRAAAPDGGRRAGPTADPRLGRDRAIGELRRRSATAAPARQRRTRPRRGPGHRRAAGPLPGTSWCWRPAGHRCACGPSRNSRWPR